MEQYEMLAHRMGALHKKVRRIQEQMLEEYQITFLEYHILVMLMQSESVSQADMAAALDVDKALISRQIQVLEKRALICRSSDPHCRRRNVLSLSQEALHLIPRVQEAYRANLAHIFSDLSEEKLGELQILMEGLIEKI